MRNHLLPLITLLLAILRIAVATAAPEPRLVFAHYHLPYAPHGATVEGYKQDIMDARHAGLDGFVLNMGGWSSEGGSYKAKTAMMFQAAHEMNNGFRLFLSPDLCCGLPARDILDMVRTYAGDPNYFHYQGRPVLSTWSGEGADGGGLKARDWWRDQVLGPLRQEGLNVFFVPMFYTANYQETPDYANVLANFNGTAKGRHGGDVPGWWHDVVDGLYYFAATGLPDYTRDNSPSVLKAGEAVARVMHENGRLFMGAVSPLYWGNFQSPGRRYFEYGGGEGLANQWKSVIEVQKPEWVELFTWTDFTEATYFSPVPDAAVHNYTPRTQFGYGFFPSHAGFTELNRYYIEWYKTGKQPPITEDRLFYFYRTHPKDMEAPFDRRGPVTSRIGDVQDVIYVTTMLTAPAQLQVLIGGRDQRLDVGPGIVHSRVPFRPGWPVFSLLRDRQKLLSSSGPAIRSWGTRYNFSVASGFASAADRPDLVIAGVSIAAEYSTGGRSQVLTATVKNEGSMPVPANAVRVRFLIGDEEAIESAPYPQPLAPGATVTLYTPLGSWKPQRGSGRVEAIVDDQDSVVENDEFNNARIATVAVGPTLDVQNAAPDQDVELDREGDLDWARWGSLELHKTATGQLLAMQTVGGKSVPFQSTPITTWYPAGAIGGLGGPPPASRVGTSGGISVPGVGNGFRLTVPASTEARVLRVYLGGSHSGGRLSAALSDNSAPRYQDSWDVYSDPNGVYGAVYTVTYRAAAPDQTLSVEWKMTSGTGSVWLQAATLGKL